MPNWCNNWLVVTGENTRDIVEKIKTDGMLFETLVGEKYQGNDDGWYDHNIDKYGTKWDVPMNEIDPSIVDDTELSFAFSTAWSPPTGFCKMLSQKYRVAVRLEFEEAGSDFAGYEEYINGEIVNSHVWRWSEGIYNLDREEEFWDNIIEWQIQEGCIDLKDYKFLSDNDMNYLKKLIKDNGKNSNSM